jgi:hypothetical protein
MEISFVKYYFYIIRMCTERQQKTHLPDNPMPHQDMIEQPLLYYVSGADRSLQEPCVVFASHPSLRSGAIRK